VDAGNLADVSWEILEPSPDGDWINHRNADFEAFASISAKDGNSGGIFAMHSGGVKTNRDAWVYNSSSAQLQVNVESMVEFYNEQIATAPPGVTPNADSTRIAWGGGLRQLFDKRKPLSVDDGGYRVGIYRPFNRQNLQFQPELNERQYRLRSMFPTSDTDNQGIYITSPASHYPTFEALMVDSVPDLHTLDTGQFFPRYTYATQEKGTLFEAQDQTGDGLERIDNITDAALTDYRAVYGPEVSKDDIFHYVYGLLHSPEYRTTFAADLKKMLPRIPQVPGTERFMAFVQAGKELSDLHTGYEALPPHPLTEVPSGLSVDQDDYARYAVKKMKYAGKAGPGTKPASSTTRRSRWTASLKRPTVTCWAHVPLWTGSLSGTRSRPTRLPESSTTRTTGPVSTNSLATLST
jgi:predicted helicase